jgi:hypothetical protein
MLWLAAYASGLLLVWVAAVGIFTAGKPGFDKHWT